MAIYTGTSGDDIYLGTKKKDNIQGQEGNDFLEGGRGKDTIEGGLGFLDRLYGEDGNDVITDPDGVLGAHGEDGKDTITVNYINGWRDQKGTPRSDGKITGGHGEDTITVTMNESSFFINLKGDEPVSNTPQDGNDEITLLGSYGNSVVDLGGGNDIFAGGSGRDNVEGKDGRDVIEGGANSDYLKGGAGNDFLQGNQDGDLLNGGTGNDTIRGGKDRDTLIGGANDDLLIGDLGDDILTGNSGEDTFAIRVGAGSDTVTDFVDGEDIIGLQRGLQFDELTVAGGDSSTQISLINTDELLATLLEVDVSQITSADFTSA